MTPNFSLSLSFEGIVLLQRVEGGWHRAGSVSLSCEDLPAEMARLRDTASRLSGGDVRVKLIIPDDQIRYLTIETARTTLDDVHAVLDAATPLALDEMEIDFDQCGGRTHIAAVAKQTLQEAEDFTSRHGFEPISFVAIAEPYTFSGEVIFGPTSFARDTLGFEGILEREKHGPIETGVLAEVALEAEAEAASETLDETPFGAEADAETDAPGDIAETVVEPAFVDDADIENGVEIDVDAETDVSEDISVTSSIDEAIDAEDDAPLPVFASRNRTSASAIEAPIAHFTHHSPDLADGLNVDVDVNMVPKMAPPLVPATVEAAEPETPVTFARAGSHPKPAPVAHRSVEAALANGFGQSNTQEPGGYWGIGLAAACIAAVGLIGFWLVRDDGVEIADLLEIDPGLQEDSINVAATPIIADPVVPQETTSDIVEETAPIVTAVPGRVLSPADAARVYAATGVWQRAPRMPDAPIEADQSTLAGIHDFAVAGEIQDVSRPGQLIEASIYHDIQIIAPSNPAPANRPLQRDADGFVLASPNGTVLPTGVLIYAGSTGPRPRLRPSDEPVAPDGLDEASAPTIPDGVVTELRYVAYTPDSGVPDLQAYAAPALTQPKTILVPQIDPQATGVALATTIATAPAPAPLGQGPAVSDTVSDALTLPGTGSAPSFVTANVTDQTPALSVPLRSVAAMADAPLTALSQVTPSPVAQTETLVADGLVEVILGKPAIVPPLRPGTPEVVAQAPETDADVATTAVQDVVDASETEAVVFQDPALAGYRPTARPADLAPTSLVTFEAIPALADARPTARPANLASAQVLVSASPDAIAAALAEATTVPAAAQPDVLDVVASIAAAAPQSLIVAPTRSAIVASPRPDTRPRNFSQLVASAQSLQQRHRARDDAASAASAVAQPRTITAPVTGGTTTVTVARAATYEDAIRLREMNLIGVYGSPGARRALVRMPNGRFVKVEVGSALDGGQVTAIGDTALNFVKRGRTYALQLPTG